MKRRPEYEKAFDFRDTGGHCFCGGVCGAVLHGAGLAHQAGGACDGVLCGQSAAYGFAEGADSGSCGSGGSGGAAPRKPHLTDVKK